MRFHFNQHSKALGLNKWNFQLIHQTKLLCTNIKIQRQITESNFFTNHHPLQFKIGINSISPMEDRNAVSKSLIKNIFHILCTSQCLYRTTRLINLGTRQSCLFLQVPRLHSPLVYISAISSANRGLKASHPSPTPPPIHHSFPFVPLENLVHICRGLLLNSQIR